MGTVDSPVSIRQRQAKVNPTNLNISNPKGLGWPAAVLMRRGPEPMGRGGERPPRRPGGVLRALVRTRHFF